MQSNQLICASISSWYFWPDLRLKPQHFHCTQWLDRITIHWIITNAQFSEQKFTYQLCLIWADFFFHFWCQGFDFHQYSFKSYSKSIDVALMHRTNYFDSQIPSLLPPGKYCQLMKLRMVEWCAAAFTELCKHMWQARCVAAQAALPK